MAVKLKSAVVVSFSVGVFFLFLVDAEIHAVFLLANGWPVGGFEENTHFEI